MPPRSSRKSLRKLDIFEQEFDALLKAAIEDQEAIEKSKVARERTQARARKQRQRAASKKSISIEESIGRPAAATPQQALRALLDIQDAPWKGSQQALADLLGVSTRSIRRWKNEGKTPRNPNVIKSLNSQLNQTKKTQRKQEQRHDIPGIKGPVPIRVKGYRTIYDTPNGPRESQSITFDLAHLTQDEQIRVILDLWRPEEYYSIYFVVDLHRMYQGQFDGSYGLKTIGPYVLLESDPLSVLQKLFEQMEDQYEESEFFLLRRVRLLRWRDSDSALQFAKRIGILDDLGLRKAYDERILNKKKKPKRTGPGSARRKFK